MKIKPRQKRMRDMVAAVLCVAIPGYRFNQHCISQESKDGAVALLVPDDNQKTRGSLRIEVVNGLCEGIALFYCKSRDNGFSYDKRIFRCYCDIEHLESGLFLGESFGNKENMVQIKKALKEAVAECEAARVAFVPAEVAEAV